MATSAGRRRRRGSPDPFPPSVDSQSLVATPSSQVTNRSRNNRGCRAGRNRDAVSPASISEDGKKVAKSASSSRVVFTRSRKGTEVASSETLESRPSLNGEDNVPVYCKNPTLTRTTQQLTPRESRGSRASAAESEEKGTDVLLSRRELLNGFRKKKRNSPRAGVQHERVAKPQDASRRDTGVPTDFQLFQPTQPAQLQAAAGPHDTTRMLGIAKPGSRLFDPLPYTTQQPNDLGTSAVVVLDAEGSSGSESGSTAVAFTKSGVKCVSGTTRQKLTRKPQGRARRPAPKPSRASRKLSTASAVLERETAADSQAIIEPQVGLGSGGSSGRAVSSSDILMGHLRRLIRSVYQNPPFWRIHTLTKPEDVSLSQSSSKRCQDAVLQLLPYLKNCRETQQSFIVLLLGAPESEKGAIISTAVRISENIHGLHPSKHPDGARFDTNQEPVTTPERWTLHPIIIPPFARDEAAYLRLITRSLFSLLSHHNYSNCEEQESLSTFIGKTEMDWAFLAGSLHAKRRQGRRVEYSSSSRAQTETKQCKEPNEICRNRTEIARKTCSQVTAELKQLTFQQNIELVKRLLEHLQRKRLIPVIVIEDMDPLVFGSAQFRQSLLYNLFNLIHVDRISLGFIGCSSLVNVSSYFEKRIRSRYGLSRIHFTSPWAPDDLLAGLRKVLVNDSALPNTSYSPSNLHNSPTSHVPFVDELLDSESLLHNFNGQVHRLVAETRIREIVEFYAALDHRCFELVVQCITQTILVNVANFVYSKSSKLINSSAQLSDASKTAQVPQQDPFSTPRATPRKRQRSFSDEVPLYNQDHRLNKTPTSAKKKLRSLEEHPDDKHPQIPTPTNVNQNAVRTPVTTPRRRCYGSEAYRAATTLDDLFSHCVFSVPSLEWKLDHHDALLPQLSLSELLILASMTQLHRKHVVPKTLVDISKEIQRIEKLSMVAGRWPSGALSSRTEYLPQRFRVAFVRLLEWGILEPSYICGNLSSSSYTGDIRSNIQQVPVKYTYYTRFLNVYSKLHLPTNVERYIQSAS